MVSVEEWCPGLEEDAYEGALSAAWSVLAVKDLAVQAKLAGATLIDGRVQLRTFGREAAIDPLCRTVTMNGRNVKELGAILILHYLANANESQPTGKTISYRQLPGGNVHYPAFRARVTEDIGTVFHHHPSQLVAAAELIGGRKQEYGDASVMIPVFPKLPVTVIVWRGDDEVRGSANVLFDESAPRFLSTEDLAAVGTFLVSRLLNARAAIVRDTQSINTV